MATKNMSAAGRDGEEREREREPHSVYVLSLPAAAAPPPAVAVSYLEAIVPRKARSRPRPRAKPRGWWAFRLPVPPLEESKNPPEEVILPIPPPSAVANSLTEEARSPRPRPKRPFVRPASPPDSSTPSPAMGKPAKRARRCLQCGATETPQWRSGPMGQGTLCNACGVRLKAAGALRDLEHRPPLRCEPPPPPSPERPLSESPPDSPIWEPGSVPDVYLVRRKPMKRGKPSPLPRTESAAAPVPAPAVFLVKKKKKTPKKKPWRPRKSAKRCLHCGTSSTPQWREGPLGRSTLCNACGVRYRQGRLLPEYRPLASPTFVPSEHANRHSAVLQLRRQQRQDKNHHHPPPAAPEHPRPVSNGLRVGGNGDSDSGDAPAGGGDDLTDPLLLRRRWHDKNEYPPTPLHQPLPQPVGSLPGDLLGGIGDPGNSAAGGNGLMGQPSSLDSLAGDLRAGGMGKGPGADGNGLIGEPSSLDALLLDGPSAPLIVDGDEPLVD